MSSNITARVPTLEPEQTQTNAIQTNTKEVKKTGDQFDYSGFMMIAFLGCIFYFMIIRPQQKKAKEQQALLSDLKIGDKITTTSGFIGTIDEIYNEKEISIDFGKGMRARVLRTAIASKYMVGKNALASENDKKAKKVVKKA